MRRIFGHFTAIGEIVDTFGFIRLGNASNSALYTEFLEIIGVGAPLNTTSPRGTVTVLDTSRTIPVGADTAPASISLQVVISH
jgi:hypothetical protein